MSEGSERRSLVAFALAIVLVGVIPASDVLARSAGLGGHERFDPDSALGRP